VADVPHAGLDPRHDALEDSLSLLERAITYVLTVQPQHVERHEMRPLATKQQRPEFRTTLGVQADHFAIENRLVAAHRVRELRVQVWPVLERVPVAGDELGVMAIDIGERPEAVVLQFVNQIGMVERLRDAEEPHRAKAGEHASSLPIGVRRSRAQRSVASPAIVSGGWRHRRGRSLPGELGHSTGVGTGGQRSIQSSIPTRFSFCSAFFALDPVRLQMSCRGSLTGCTQNSVQE
jgi:hypothetical protein